MKQASTTDHANVLPPADAAVPPGIAMQLASMEARLQDIQRQVQKIFRATNEVRGLVGPFAVPMPDERLQARSAGDRHLPADREF